ncbi:signal peptidase II [Luteipulveratus sp. YIM 133296]|uniref:Lipoprotein signal peptidase n=1 Tax=Luteipulveratus flavus TaxID=3031728 RepID=A0ABT6C6R0_9MICO|nr:signal peptidase II [Luteipulveratus sp. YIM 133296]
MPEPRPSESDRPDTGSTVDPAGERRGLAVGKILLLVVVAASAYALDQLSKAWAVSSLDVGVPRELVGDLLQLRRTSNPGAAFSIATNATWILTVVACCVIACTIYVARRLRSRGWACALGLLIGGALGNLTDRFFRAPGGGKGHVVDFLELPNWPIFNVADMCIVSAAVLICVLAFVGIGVDGSRAADEEDEDEELTADGDDRDASSPQGSAAEVGTADEPRADARATGPVTESSAAVADSEGDAEAATPEDKGVAETGASTAEPHGRTSPGSTRR